MHSKEERAQPVGNAKVRGEFDTEAATAVGPNTNDAFLFPRLRSDHDGKHSVALPWTSDVIRRFNRDTARLATLVVPPRPTKTERR